MRRRILVAVIIGELVGWFHFTALTYSGDIAWPLCAARALLHNDDPYTCSYIGTDGHVWPTNPLTTALAVPPLAPLSDSIAGALFVGLSSALLAFAVTQNQQWWRLLLFCTYPYLIAMGHVQWSILLTAVALMPALLPLTLVKPQLGIPIALIRLTWRRTIACSTFLLLSFLVDPGWPLRWWPQAQSYDGFVPLLVLPLGPLLLLALTRWRTQSAQFLVLMAMLPKRGWYDALPLFILPKTRWQMIAMVIWGWGPILVMPPGNYAFKVVLATYLPALIIVLYPRLQRTRLVRLFGRLLPTTH